MIRRPIVSATAALIGILGCLRALAAAPANFAVVVDTSGSVVGYYQRRDPRPPLVLELVESLVTETMTKGDRLVVLSFDHQVHDTPGEIVALATLDPTRALQAIERIHLHTRPGIGTVRTAGLRRGAKALLDLAEQGGRFSGGVIFVVTDRDNDTMCPCRIPCCIAC